MPQLTENIESKIEEKIENSQFIKTKKGVSLEWFAGSVLGLIIFVFTVFGDLKSEVNVNSMEIQKMKEGKIEEKAQRDRIEIGVDNLRREVQKVREDVIEIKTRNSVNESNHKSF